VYQKLVQEDHQEPKELWQDECPLEKASFLQLIFFSWANPLFKHCKVGRLSPDNIGKLPKDSSAEANYE